MIDLLRNLFQRKEPLPTINAPGLKMITTAQGEKWEVDPVANEGDIGKLLELVIRQALYSQSLVEPDNEETRRFFEVFHSELFKNFTGVLKVMHDDDPDAFSRYEELVQEKIREEYAQHQKGDLPFTHSYFNDVYAWPLHGPLIMGSTSTIHDECRDYADKVARLAPIVEQAISSG